MHLDRELADIGGPNVDCVAALAPDETRSCAAVLELCAEGLAVTDVVLDNDAFVTEQPQLQV